MGGWRACEPLPRRKRQRCGRWGRRAGRGEAWMGRVRGEGAGDRDRRLSAASRARKRSRQGPARRGASSRVSTAACNCCSHSPGRLSSLMLFLGNLWSIATPFPATNPSLALLRERRPGKDGRPPDAGRDSPDPLGIRRGKERVRAQAGGQTQLRERGRGPRRAERQLVGGGRQKLLPFSPAGAEGERGTRAETGQSAAQPRGWQPGRSAPGLQRRALKPLSTGVKRVQVLVAQDRRCLNRCLPTSQEG